MTVKQATEAKRRLEFFQVDVPQASLDLVADVLRANRLSEGVRVAQFERELARSMDLPHVVATNSGTAALHLALAVAGVGAGDEVILPAQTFVSTGLAVLMQGAVPRFADIDPATGNIDPESARELLTDRTRVILPVHWGGYPCDLDEIHAIAKQYGLLVVEDAAHALGATYHEASIGSISDFTAFSFQAIQHVTTGDGGALCCRLPSLEDAARRRRCLGIDRVYTNTNELGERDCEIEELGYKYHMNEVAAAIGLGSLTVFHERLARREEIALRYRRELADIPGLDLLRNEDDRTSAWWLFTTLVDNRLEFVRKLGSNGIPASVVYQRIDRHPVFGGVTMGLPGQREFDARQISIPLHPGLSDDDVEHVITTIRSGW